MMRNRKNIEVLNSEARRYNIDERELFSRPKEKNKEEKLKKEERKNPECSWENNDKNVFVVGVIWNAMAAL